MHQYGATLWAVGSIILMSVVLKAFVVHRRYRARAAAKRQELAWPARESSEYWEPTGPDPLGRRRAFRRDGNHVPVQLIGVFDNCCQGWVVNRSSEGICIAVPGPVAVGRTFLVLPDLAPAGTAPAEVEVRWCEEQADHHQIGCRFTTPLTTTNLLLFG